MTHLYVKPVELTHSHSRFVRYITFTLCYKSCINRVLFNTFRIGASDAVKSELWESLREIVDIEKRLSSAEVQR